MTITIDMLERRIEEIYNNPHLSDETKENFVKQKKELIDKLLKEEEDLKNECDLNSFENQGYEG